MLAPARAASRTARSAAVVGLLALALGVLLPTAAVATTATATEVSGTPTDGLPPGVGVLLLDVPTERAADPRANAYIVDHAIPGAVVERRVRVSNGTDEVLPVQLRGVAARADDGWVVDERSVAPGPEQLASWISVEPPQLLLAPQSVQTVTVTITVPPGAGTDEQYAVVVAEPPAQEAGGIGYVSRVGLRVYLTVGTGDEPMTDFTIDTLQPGRNLQGVPTVLVGVANVGGRAIDVSGELLLVSEDGQRTAGPFPTVLPATIGPATRGTVLVALDDDLAPGPWTATATLRSGTVERVAQASLTFPGGAGEVADPVEATEVERRKRVLVPFAAALLLGAIAGLWWLILAKRRAEDEEELAEDEPVERAAEGLPAAASGRR